MKRAAGVVLVLALAGWIGWRGYQTVRERAKNGQARPGRAQAVAVVVAPVARDTMRDVREYSGTILPRSQFLVAPKVAGRLDRLLVNVGDEIKNGDLIAHLDDMEYQQQVEQARAERDVAAANVLDLQSALDIATREFERSSELRKRQVVSDAYLEQAEAQFRAAQAKHAVAQAQVKQREAALKAAEVRLSYTRIEAVWADGHHRRVIGERFVDQGAMLRANDPIVSVLDTHVVLAVIFVIERDYPLLALGQTASIITDAFSERRFTGQVVRKAPMLREASRQARIEIEVENLDRALAPGMFARVSIEFTARENAIVVPPAALARRDGKTGVFLADADALRARFVPVTTGIVNSQWAEVTEPPLAGNVVTLGHHLLEDGAAIILPGSRP